MNKRRYRAVLFLGAVCLLIVGACGLWLRSEQRQEALNRQLIVALAKNDPQQALALVNVGADPNTPYESPYPLSLTRLWNRLIHRRVLPGKNTLSAFHIACGAHVPDYGDPYISLNTDEPYLVETMLQHGAQKNAKDGDGWTPFFWSVVVQHPKTAEVLLSHGVDANVPNPRGFTALEWAPLNSSAATPPQRSQSANLVGTLLAHGADPNLTLMGGPTPLQIAHDSNRPDLVGLLKQAGAKK